MTIISIDVNNLVSPEYDPDRLRRALIELIEHINQLQQRLEETQRRLAEVEGLSGI